MRYCQVASERSACDASKESVESSSGLVIAEFSPINFERLESFQEIAQKTGRELVAMAKDVYLLHNLQCINGSKMTEGLRIYDEVTDESRRKWEQKVVKANYDDRYVDHKAIRDNPDNYILCFSFFDMKHLLDFKPEGGNYIYSSCEAFNEEMEIDFQRLWQWLKRRQALPALFHRAPLWKLSDFNPYTPNYWNRILPRKNILERP